MPIPAGLCDDPDDVIVIAASPGFPAGYGCRIGPTIDLGTPQGDLFFAFDRMELWESVLVRSRFYLPVAADAEIVSAGEQVDEVLVEVEGDLTVILSAPYSDSPFNVFGEPRTDFHLLFLQEQPGSAAPIETEIVAHENRLTKDTTVNKLRTYATHAEWWNDYGRRQAGIAMFIWLALTGGRIIEDDLYEWPEFEGEEVIQTEWRGHNGSEFNVFEANRVNESGDAEEWKVWVDGDGLPRRIELSIESEDPTSSVHDAEMEITYSGETFQRPRPVFQ
jgi:hypothetical protein